MRIACILIGLTALAPVTPQEASITGPQVLIVGSNSGGSVRATYKCAGLGAGPVIDVHTKDSAHGLIRDLDVLITAPGEATFSFTLEYASGTTNPKELWIFLSKQPTRQRKQ